MATIKSYTDIEQSKKLAEILPLESADMFYADLLVDSKHQYISHYLETYGFKTFEDTKQKESKHLSFIPCWSLAALLNVLPEYNLQRTDWGNKTEYKIVVTTDEDNYASKNYDNPVDACVAMIENLHELNLL